jgi:hypothetical protein
MKLVISDLDRHDDARERAITILVQSMSKGFNEYLKRYGGPGLCKRHCHAVEELLREMIDAITTSTSTLLPASLYVGDPNIPTNPNIMTGYIHDETKNVYGDYYINDNHSTTLLYVVIFPGECISMVAFRG